MNGTELQREFHNYILFVCMCKTELMPGITQVATMHLLYVDSMYTNSWRTKNMEIWLHICVVEAVNELLLQILPSILIC